MKPFRDRTEAGKALAVEVGKLRGLESPLVLALPRGGVPVAFEVARAIGAPLDVFLVRKLGVPGREEFAMGAIASGGVRVLNEDVVRDLEISDDAIAAVAANEERELRRRETCYRGDLAPVKIEGRDIVLVDDGLATGSTMRAAVIAVRRQRPRRIIVAVPVAATDTCAGLRDEVDTVLCTKTPRPFHAVGHWYEDFAPVSDDEVHALLERAGVREPAKAAGTDRYPT